ncbi:MAG: ABC transporter permease [Ferruginibacter sp.]
MFKNYFKTGWRVLVRNKPFSVINIAGLALGMACSLLIMLWVQDEKNVDAFHANGNQLYQVYERQFYDGKTEASYPTQGLLADELKKSVPEVQYASSMEYASAPGSLSTFEAGEKVNKMNGSFAGADFFKMFSYPLLQGNAATALNEPGCIAVSRKMAEIFFGDAAAAINKTIRFENKEDLKITAVFEDVPANSSVQFEFLRTWKDFVKQNEWVNNWGNTSPATYIQLRRDAAAANVQTKIKDFIYKYQPKTEGWVVELGLQPYTEKYLHSSFKEGQPGGGRIEYVRLFTLVAIFVLLIACINFMNLSTARAGTRAKEIGVRKVNGAYRSSLVWQFISEAVLLSFMAACVALLLVFLVLPVFNDITGKQLLLPVSTPVFWMLMLALVVLTGLVAGSYPAFFLSSFRPVKILKGHFSLGNNGALLRKGLVVFQFSLSVILIVGMMVIYRQVDFIQKKNIGYERENLLYVPIEGELAKNYGHFKEEAAKIPGVLAVSKMRNSPTVIEHHTNSIGWQGKDPNVTVSFADGVVGYEFAKTMKLQLKEGRDFSKEYGTDSAAYLLNETAVSKIGLKNPVGATVTWGNRPGTVVGVLKDFHFSSMHQAIDPLIMRLDENWGWGTILIRMQAGETKAVLAGLEKISKSMNPKFPFTYQFSDQEYAKLYNSEQVVSKLANSFAIVAIFISCLGLLGLATFVANQRRKEIGIRKVLGANTAGITVLLSKDFAKLVLIAIVIAIPVSYWAMNKWLQDFAYKAAISWWVFALAAVAALLIAICTVSVQAVKAALVNPVKSLKEAP